MKLEFAFQKQGYLFTKDELPTITVDVSNDRDYVRTIDLSVKVESFDKSFSQVKKVHKSILGIWTDRFVFEFEDVREIGTYIVSAEILASDERVFSTVSLDILASKSESAINNYSKRIEVSEPKEVGSFSNSDVDATPGAGRNSAYYKGVATKSVPVEAALEDVAYRFEKDEYVYELAKDGVERVSRKKDGGYVNILSSLGKFRLNGADGEIVSAGKVIEYTILSDDKIKVCYEAVGKTAEPVEIYNIYTFHDRYLSVEAHVSCSDFGSVVDSTQSCLERCFTNGYSSVKRLFNCDWLYPTDGDYPFKYLDSWTTINTVDDFRVYTFNRGDIFLRYWNFFEVYPEANLPTNFESGNKLNYSLTYDLVITGNEGNTDYDALFISRGSDFAAGVAPVVENDDNTGIFIGEARDFAINIKSLTDTTTAVSVKYDIRDYYGNVLDAGLFENEPLKAGESLNRVFNIDPKLHGYGIFFLNLIVKSGKYTYREYYSFAFLEEYEYKHNATSPFGLIQIIRDVDVPYSDSLSLCKKIGVAVARGAFLDLNHLELSKEYLKKARDMGMRIFCHPAPWENHEKFLEEFHEYFDACCLGNELNCANIFGAKTTEECYQDYYNNFLSIAKDLYRDKYGKKIISAGISGGQISWYDKLYEKGAWDDIDTISLHVYGIPYSPDCRSQLKNIWSCEGGLIRQEEVFQKYGRKPFMINETGYHNSQDKTQVSLRTQADYNLRCYLLSLAYGAEHVAAYCFYDFSGMGQGTVMNDMEYHYGHFYYPDYYGRVLPKPTAVAYANMTRLLESATSTEETEYSGGDHRVFRIKTKDQGTVYAAWSNCAPQPNDITDFTNLMPDPGKREPLMPWQNQWKGKEYIYIKNNAKEAYVVDAMGHRTKIKTGIDGNVCVEVTGAPIFIVGIE